MAFMFLLPGLRSFMQPKKRVRDFYEAIIATANYPLV